MDTAEIVQVRETRYHPSVRSSQEYRSEYARDYGRLIHSPAFRRLQGKSQVFGAGSGDYYRTRLTHTLEVAQISRQVATTLAREYSVEQVDKAAYVIDPQVVECAALAHDLGHPPFGHTGERVLDKLLKPALRYEGNAQNFRIMMFLEKRAEVNEAGTTNAINGLNLTSAVLLATNKYPFLLNASDNEQADVPYLDERKGLYRSEWAHIRTVRERWKLNPGEKTLEAQLMDLCDDIAYSTHDLEDGIRAGKVDVDNLSPDHREYARVKEAVLEELQKDQGKGDRLWTEDLNLAASIDAVLSQYHTEWIRILRASGDSSRARRELTSYWVNRFSSHAGIVPTGDWKSVTFVTDGKEDLQLRRAMAILKKLAWVLMVRDFRIQRLERRCEFVLERLWDILGSASAGEQVIPHDWVARRKDHLKEWPWERVAADYLAGCTDAYAERLYGELFAGSKYGSIYEMD